MIAKSWREYSSAAQNSGYGIQDQTEQEKKTTHMKGRLYGGKSGIEKADLFEKLESKDVQLDWKDIETILISTGKEVFGETSGK